jgi:hypothetical protein
MVKENEKPQDSALFGKALTAAKTPENTASRQN